MELSLSISNKVDKCRVCNAELPSAFFDLGVQPLANNLLSDIQDDEPLVPLSLVHCPCCELVQLTHTVAPDVLFRDYVWVSGTAKTTRDYADVFCDAVMSRLPAGNDVIINEVASNDGTFLRPFANRGMMVLGIDPARNIAEIAQNSGIPTYSEFFGTDAASYVVNKQGNADVVIARNVIPHVADVNDVIAGIHILLKENGLGVIEFHDASVIQQELHYDSIYHEHLFYFTITTIIRLLAQHGLHGFDISQSPISGGSIVIYFSKQAREKSEALQVMIDKERVNGVNALPQWQRFAQDCALHKSNLIAVIHELRAKGKVIAGYGASARSATMLNYCGLGREDIAVIADQNTMKQGRLAPGSHIPIVSPEDAIASQPDAFILLAWNFSQELRELLFEKYDFSGTIIQPLPNEVTVK